MLIENSYYKNLNVVCFKTISVVKSNFCQRPMNTGGC